MVRENNGEYVPKQVSKSTTNNKRYLNRLQTKKTTTLNNLPYNTGLYAHFTTNKYIDNEQMAQLTQSILN